MSDRLQAPVDRIQEAPTRGDGGCGPAQRSLAGRPGRGRCLHLRLPFSSSQYSFLPWPQRPGSRGDLVCDGQRRCYGFTFHCLKTRRQLRVFHKREDGELVTHVEPPNVRGGPPCSSAGRSNSTSGARGREMPTVPQGGSASFPTPREDVPTPAGGPVSTGPGRSHGNG